MDVPSGELSSLVETKELRRWPSWVLTTLVLVGLGAAVAVLAWKPWRLDTWVPRHVFLFLACIPSAVGLLYFATSQLSRLQALERSARTYTEKGRAGVRTLSRGARGGAEGAPARSNPLFDVGTVRDSVSSVVLQTLSGAFALAGVLMVVAIMSNSVIGLGSEPPARVAQGAAQAPPSSGAKSGADVPSSVVSAPRPVAAAGAAPATQPPAPGAAADTASAAVAQSGTTMPAPSPVPSPAVTPTSVQRDTGQRGESLVDPLGRRGLVFAGYGAYIFVLLNIIHRINAGWLAGKFMLTSSIRVAIAIVLGFAAERVGLFNFVNEPQQPFVFMAVGLFPDWAFMALRQRVREAFQTPTEAEQVLPMSLVDGIDERAASRLEEAGIWDIQHLANTDPRELAVITLMPVRRVLDWIDQAILIQYVRAKIAVFRDLGVRGVVDFVALYGRTFADGPEGANAKEVLAKLVAKLEWHQSAVLNLAQNLWEDSQVDLIWRMWQLDEAKA